MSKKVTFIKKGTVNGVDYNEGDELKVSSSIFKRLVEEEEVAKESSNKEKKIFSKKDQE